jgi:hypothetical protein
VSATALRAPTQCPPYAGPGCPRSRWRIRSRRGRLAAPRGTHPGRHREHAFAPRAAALVLGYARLPESGLRAAASALLAAMDD